MQFGIVIALAGCTTMQSSRVLDPGKTQLGVGVTRITLNEDDEPIYAGEVRVARGVSDTFELGAHLVRTPGMGEAFSSLGIDPKFQVSRSATSAVSVAIPFSVAWTDEGFHDLATGTIQLFPTLYAGVDLSKNVELVFSPRAGIAKLSKEGSDPIYGIGAAIGLHIGDAATSSALHPEFSILNIGSVEDSGDSETFVMIGIGVTAGD
ncbi:MAG: hypothetical protein H0T46_16675 [Deltaproteobacteria bacterium]|nr:hypothetical protein [Deltaproteobacteria bacterium]